MDRTENMKFAESVMLIDVTFLGNVIADLQSHFSQVLGRKLQTVDLSELVSYIALDGGLGQGASQQIQVLLVYDDLSAKIPYAQPADVEKELNNVAFRNELGEFSFYAFRPEQFVSTDEFLAESFRIVAADEAVRRFWFVGEPGNEVFEENSLPQEVLKKKEMVIFRMSEPAVPNPFRWELLGYPVMRALGIRGDELPGS